MALPFARALAGAPVDYRDYSRLLPDYLRALARAGYEKRNAALARLDSREAVATRQTWARSTFWELSGAPPKRTPLNPRTTGSLQRRGYRMEKVVYESVPGFSVPANLYVPSGGTPPYPGVLFQMGHSFNGKAYDSYQRCCQGLVRLGFVVLAFDPMGQGERIYYPDSSGTHTRLRSSDDEHTVPGRQLLLYGDTSTRIQAWDAVRSLDYLAGLPYVDPKRLASTGQSGGGTTTMMLCAADERLACAYVAMGNTENFLCADFNPPGSTDDAEQNFLGGAEVGFDRWDMLYPMAPKPLGIGVSAKDAFGTYSPAYIANGAEEFAKLRKVYDTLGAADRLRWYESPLPHGLSYDMRMEVYNWFSRWLQGRKDAVADEPEINLEKEAALWVAPAGNVVRGFGSKTPFALNRQRTVTPQGKPLQDLLSLDPLPAAPAVRVISSVRSHDVRIEAIEVPSAGGVFVPAWLFLPPSGFPSKPLLMLAEPGGRNRSWGESGLCQALAAKGHVVCAPDVRGIGDMAPEFGRGAAHYARSHNEEEDYAWASLMLGKPLVGQRTSDLLAVAAALRGYEPVRGRRLVLAASGKLTVPALFAASLDSALSALYLNAGLVSFHSVIANEDYSHPLANFVPGFLRHTDLPQVAAGIAPRKVILAGMVDAAGRSLDAAAVHAEWRSTPNAEVRAASAWTAEALGAL